MGETGSIADNARMRSIANMTGVDPASAAAGGITARSMGARALRSTVLEPIENWQFRRALKAVETPPAPSPIKNGIAKAANVGGNITQAIAPLIPVQSMAEYLRQRKSNNKEK